jgi:hypothetical protein
MLYTIFSGWQVWVARDTLKVARDTFNASNRPYIGVSRMNVHYFPHNATSMEQAGKIPASDTTRFSFSAEVKNFGQVPGTECKIRWRVFLDGVEMKESLVPDSPDSMFPSEEVGLVGNIGEKDYSAIQRGNAVLAVDVLAEYNGPSGHYKYCSRQQYTPNLHAFISLGAQCAP